MLFGRDIIFNVCFYLVSVTRLLKIYKINVNLILLLLFFSVFDSLLYRPPTKHDVSQYSEVQKVLRDEIVNPLRKNFYVRADRVMKLRTLLDKLSSVSGLTSEEKGNERPYSRWWWWGWGWFSFRIRSLTYLPHNSACRSRRIFKFSPGANIKG